MNLLKYKYLFLGELKWCYFNSRTIFSVVHCKVEKKYSAKIAVYLLGNINLIYQREMRVMIQDEYD